MILRNFFRRRATSDNAVLDAPPLQVAFPPRQSFAIEEFGRTRRTLRERSKANDEQGGEETGEGRHKLGEEKIKMLRVRLSQDQGNSQYTTDLGLSEREPRRRDERGEFPRRRGQRVDR